MTFFPRLPADHIQQSSLLTRKKNPSISPALGFTFSGWSGRLGPMQWLGKSEAVTSSLLPQLSVLGQTPALHGGGARPVLLCSHLLLNVEESKYRGRGNSQASLHAQEPKRECFADPDCLLCSAPPYA